VKKLMFLMLVSCGAVHAQPFILNLNLDIGRNYPFGGTITDSHGIWTADVSNDEQGGYGVYQGITVEGNHFVLSDINLLAANSPADNYFSFDIERTKERGVFSVSDIVFGPEFLGGFSLAGGPCNSCSGTLTRESGHGYHAVPEINPATTLVAITLLAGGLIVLKGCRLS
jgi:hypothetical protein